MRARRAIWVGFLANCLKRRANGKLLLSLIGNPPMIVALDGNLVPHSTAVPVLWLGTAERISAIVEMKQPGVWVLGETVDEDRERGMGIVVEYAGAKGEPQWEKPEPFRWDYRRFAKPDAAAAQPDETIALTIAARIGARDGSVRGL